jgi:hypothetical protein
MAPNVSDGTTARRQLAHLGRRRRRSSFVVWEASIVAKATTACGFRTVELIE